MCMRKLYEENERFRGYVDRAMQHGRYAGRSLDEVLATVTVRDAARYYENDDSPYTEPVNSTYCKSGECM